MHTHAYKRFMMTLALALSLSTAGCKITPAPLPAQAVDSVDANANEILQPAHAFAATLVSAVLSTDTNTHIELTDAEKTVLVNLDKSLNIADAIEVAYHKSPTAVNANSLTAAAKVVEANLVSAQSVIALPTALPAAKK